MRVISGKYKNKLIATGAVGGKDSFRPTTSKVRSAVFNKLRFSRIARSDGLLGARVLDLCCGSGALGLEALSQGAEWVTFIDNSYARTQLVNKNIEHFGVSGQCLVLCINVERLPRCKGLPFDIIYIDPPYGNGDLITTSLVGLICGGWLSEDALVVVESELRYDPIVPDGLILVDEAKYGNTKVLYFLARHFK